MAVLPAIFWAMSAMMVKVHKTLKGAGAFWVIFCWVFIRNNPADKINITGRSSFFILMRSP